MTVSDSTIAEYLNVKPEQIMASHEADGVVTVVVDNGIAGCPKYAIPLSDLAIVVRLQRKAVPKPAPKPKAAPRTRKKAAKK